jgi:hypothetical protein
MERICLPQMLELIQSKAGFSPTLTRLTKIVAGEETRTHSCLRGNEHSAERAEVRVHEPRQINPKAGCK